jgi:hypothetical protein
MIVSKSKEILKLLDEGKNSKEIIDKGYKPGTVYSTQREWRQGVKVNAVGIDNLILKQTKGREALSEIDSMVLSAKAIGAEKRNTCSNNNNGLCTFWGWVSQDDAPKGVGELVSQNDEWKIKPSEFYCALCADCVR